MLGEHRVRDGLRILRERVRAGAGRPVAPAGRCDWVPTAGRSRSLAPAQRHDPGPSGDHRSRPVVAREKRLERGLQTLASVLGDGPERGGVRPPVDENRLHGVGHLRARHRRHAADREVAGGRMHFAATDFRNRRHLFFFFLRREPRFVRFSSARTSFATSWVTDRATDRSSHSPKKRARFRKRMHENDPAAHTVHPRDERPLRVHQRYRGTPLCVRVRLARESRCDRRA